MNNSSTTDPRTGSLRLALSATERILVIEAHGPFDDWFAVEYEKQIMPFRVALESSPWASLAIIKGTEKVLDQKMRDYLVNSIAQARGLGLVVTALVIDAKTQKQLDYWHKLYRETGLRYQLFTNKDEAHAWLLLQLVAQQ